MSIVISKQGYHYQASMTVISVQAKLCISLSGTQSMSIIIRQAKLSVPIRQAKLSLSGEQSYQYQASKAIIVRQAWPLLNPTAALRKDSSLL